MRFRSVSTSSPLLFSLALTPLLALSCAAPDSGDAGGGGSGGAEAGEEVVSEARGAVAITKTIPIRFIEAMNCKPGTAGCNSATSLDILNGSVQRANGIYAAAGVKLWVKSVERYFLPKFAERHDTKFFWYEVKSALPGSGEDSLRTVFPAMPAGAYHDIDDVKTMANWVGSAAAFYGDPDELLIWITNDGDEGANSFAWGPDQGRAVVQHAHNLVNPDNGLATTSLAHETGHFFGLPHVWEDPGGMNPATGALWNFVDEWDLVYCMETATEPNRFYASRQEFIADNCPLPRVRVIEMDMNWNVDGIQSNCSGTDPGGYEKVVCTFGSETFESGDPQLNGMFWIDPNTPHAPPGSSKYGVNVMDYYGNTLHDLVAPAKFSASQLARMEAYRTADITLAPGWQDVFLRDDGAVPTSGNPDGINGLRPLLGTSTEDFISWGNGGEMSFKTTTVPVSGTSYTPVSGDFDNDGFDDILWYNPTTGNAYIWWFAANKGHTSSALLSFGAGYTVLTGNFDASTGDDIFFYRPGVDKMYWGNGTRTLGFPSSPYQGPEGYVGATGDFDGLGSDDIVWYNPVTGAIQFSWAVGSTRSFVNTTSSITSGMKPIPGNFDGQGGTDIYWYAPGLTAEQIWFSNGNRLFDVRSSGMFTTYTVIAGDFDGDGADDIFWDAEASTNDLVWRSSKNRNAPFEAQLISVNGSFRPVAGKFDGTWQGKNTTDIFWYRK